MDNSKTRITLTLPKVILDKIDLILKDDFLSRSQFILKAVKEKIDKEEAKKGIL